MQSSSREKILLAATQIVQAHGYSGLNFRDLAEQVGIRAASIYHHFPSKADLAAAVARRYWEDSAAELETLSSSTLTSNSNGSSPSSDALSSLQKYPETFRRALLNNNRMCLSSFMATEYDDLPELVMKEVNTFADVNIAWLKKNLSRLNDSSLNDSSLNDSSLNDLSQLNASDSAECEARARAIFAAVAGAQLVARSRSDVAVYDAIIASYRAAKLIPG